MPTRKNAGGGNSRGAAQEGSDKRASFQNSKQGGSARSLGSSSERSSRVKRTIRKQQDSVSVSGGWIDTLTGAAQAFLYPETNNKENNRSNKNTKVDESGETAENSDDTYYDDEEETFTSMASTTRSLDTRTPPPNLGAMAPSSSVKRPIPVASPNSSFDPVFPSSSFGESHHQPSPIARMRAPVQEQAPQQESSYDEQSRYSENFVADKHRKWRRQIKLQKKRLASKHDDDASLLTTCAPPSTDQERNKLKSKSRREKRRQEQEPARMLAQLMRVPCASVDDVMADCHDGSVSSSDEEDDDIRNNSLTYDDDDDDSTHYDTSVTESEGTDERRSDFTGGTESTMSSSRRQSPSSAASSARTSSSVAPGNAPLRGVLKASSFGNSSVQTSSSAALSHEKTAQPGDQNFIQTFIEVRFKICFNTVISLTW